MADQDTYAEFWKKAAVYGCKEPGSNAPVRGMKPLWMDVQHALNAIPRLDTSRQEFGTCNSSIFRKRAWGLPHMDKSHSLVAHE